jgi:hypothetical protein
LSNPEYEVVTETIALVHKTQHRFAPLMRAIAWHPIPFFGSLSSARVLTFGLNPSAGEFSAGRSWPVQISPELLTKRLVGYFRINAPSPHSWFRPWTEALHLFGVTYDHDAAHIDLSPRPTAAARNFREATQKSLFLEMLRVDAPVWLRALDAAPNVKLLLIAGSATKQYYINEFMQSELSPSDVTLSPVWRRGTGEGQIAFQELRLRSGRRIPVFFCSSGPSKGEVLVKSISQNTQYLRRIVGEPSAA